MTGTWESLVGIGARGAAGAAMALLLAAPPAGAASWAVEATVTVDAAHPGAVVDGRLLGSNLPHNVPAATSVDDPGFVEATRRMGVSPLRWPGGNQSDLYDWKRDEMIEPGVRRHVDGLVDMLRMLRFARQVGAEPAITVNFGTMNAADAADLVELLNGPADSTWGSVRASWGFPEPIGVRFFEIGNEENQPHMWFFSWTAENPWKYFFGGEEERRGFYGGSRNDPVGAKGDFFAASGEPGATYRLRFPPVRDVQVFWAADRQHAEDRSFEEWRRVDDLGAAGPGEGVFTVDEVTGALQFGDGVHGKLPPADSYFLVEYTTYGHDGFVDFVRAMRAAPSSVPIQIGAATVPFVDGKPIGDDDAMRQIFEAMDFFVRHQYDAGFPKEAWSDQAARRQIPWERVNHLATTYQRMRSGMDTLGVDRPLFIGVTEWNIFLAQQAWRLDRTLEGGVLAAEWIVRVLGAGETAPVRYATQFALPGGNLALIRSQTNGSVSPMGLAFEGFAPWTGGRLLPVTVDSPGARAYDVELPYLTAAAALAPGGRVLHLALVNDSVDVPVTVTLELTGFTPVRAVQRLLTADRADAGNDEDPEAVTLEETTLPLPLAPLTVPAHSVAFLELHAAGGATRPRTRAVPAP